MHPSADDLQDWECCGKTPSRVPAKHCTMQMCTVFTLPCLVFEDTFVSLVFGGGKKILANVRV